MRNKAGTSKMAVPYQLKDEAVRDEAVKERRKDTVLTILLAGAVLLLILELMTGLVTYGMGIGLLSLAKGVVGLSKALLTLGNYLKYL